MSDSYIRVTEKLAKQGITNGTCYEDYVSGYQSGTVTDLAAYETLVMEAEAIAEEEHKEILERNTAPIVDEAYQEVLAQREAGQLTEEELQTLAEYETLMKAYAASGVNVSLSYSVYAETADTTASEALQATAADDAQPYASLTGKWYDNIGTTGPTLPQKATYSNSDYDLLNLVKKGDVIRETKGIIAYYTGHIAVSCGKYWDFVYKQYFICLIEANLNGVVYGVLDDTRFEDRGIKIYHVSSATSTNISNVITFCKNQLGKPYNLNAILNVLNGTGTGKCNSTTTATEWYCSELCWGAYYSAGINLNNSNSIPYHIYLPATLASSSKLTYRLPI